MNLNSLPRPRLRPGQFTLARLVSWVVLAAVVCFLFRNSVLAQLIMMSAAGLIEIAIGLRVIVTKRPFLVPSRWMSIGYTLSGAAIFIRPLDEMLRSRAPGWLGVFGVMLCLILLQILCYIVMWWLMSGYTAFGVTDSSIREGLLAALKKLDLPHVDLPPEKARSVMRLPTLGADLHWTSDCGFGPGLIFIKQRKFAAVLEDIAKEMNDYHRSCDVQVQRNMVFGVVHLIFGAVFIGLGVFMPLMQLRLLQSHAR